MPEASPRSRLVFAVLLAVAFWASPSEATNSPIELKTVLARLTGWLPGQFDSEPQRFFEVEMKIAAEKVHGRVYRSFVRIEAPEVGETVFVATVRYGGKEGQFDPGEFQVWTLSVDLERAAVRMSPRRFADPAKFRDGARSAATFKGLKAADLLPAAGAAGCDVFWRLNGKQLLGRTASGGCSAMSTTL